MDRTGLIPSIVLSLALAACSSKAPTPAPAPAPASWPAPAPASSPSPAPASSPAPAPAPASADPLKVGDPAPDVTLTLHDGKTVTLASHAGQRVLVYFYPKDDTPGCTVEAQGLRDRYADLQAAGIAVYGVSFQDAASHQAFIAKHDLPFPLVVDGDGAVAKAFRVPELKPAIAKRQSFLIGKDGKLEAVWLDVDPTNHAADVLAAAAK